ncbi:MAG: thiamine diphosphokinase [Chloroflexi bacterium]|nr:thiamine diphosphokinase [Chloroflexota bacterium]
MRAVVVANGHLSHPALDGACLRPDDWVLAADGGLRNCTLLGINPAVIIGDLDSVSPSDLPPLQSAGVTIVQHPERKDETDLELALAYAVAHGSREILVLGALGDRWDQTLANALLLASPTLEAVLIWMVDGLQQVALARPDRSIALHGHAGDTVSLLPLAGDALGVTTSGLEYPLDNETLLFAATRGVSNTLLGTTATVQITAGLLLVVHHQSAVSPREDPR